MGLVDILRKAREKGVRPPPPDGFVEKLSEEDDFEEVGATAQTDPATVTIEYVNSKGQESLRTITIRAIEVSTAGHLCLKAECHAKEMPRTFRLDRIQTVIDGDGEVHGKPVEFLREVLGDESFDDVQNFFPGRRKSKPAPSSSVDEPCTRKDARAEFRRDARNHARVLVAIARADGRFSDGEDTPIAEFLSNHFAPDDFDDKDARWVLGYVRRMNPTPENVEEALASVAKRLRYLRQESDDQTELMAFLTTVKQVIMADGEADPREIAILRELTELAT